MREVSSQLNSRILRTIPCTVFRIALCILALGYETVLFAQSFQAALAERQAAYQSGDQAKVKSFLADDVVFKLPGGKSLSRKEMELLVAISTPQSNYREEHTIEKTQIRKDAATVSVKLTDSYDAKLKDGSMGILRTVSKRREHWKYNGQQWRIQMVEYFQPESQTFNDKQQDDLFTQVVRETPSVAVYQSYLSTAEREWLQQGKSLFFVYRYTDGALILRPPVLLDDQKIAALPQGHWLKIKVEPGEHRFNSEADDVVSIKAESGKIYHFELGVKTGFPKGRGWMRLDTSGMGLQMHLLPTLYKIHPLEDKHIDDLSKVLR